MKLERINTKIVVAVGVAIILVLTIIFVIFNTDIIVKHNKKDTNTNSNSGQNTEVVSEEAKDRLKDVNLLNAEEKKYIIEQNFLGYLKEIETTILEQMKIDCLEKDSCPFGIEDYLVYTEDPLTKISGCSGKLSVTFDKNDPKVDMSGVSCSSSTGNTNTNYEDPEDSNYNTTGTISESVKNRTKPAKTLNQEEKLYIMKENFLSDILGAEQDTLDYFEKNCTKPGVCKNDSSIYGRYSDNSDSGYVIKGCTGDAYFVYVPGYVTATKNTKGALEIVDNNTKKLTDTQIKLSDVKTHIMAGNAPLGDYVVKQGNGYVKSTKDEKDALRVVEDTVKPEKDEIKTSEVVPYYDITELKVGDYVTKGTYVIDSSKVTCKQG